MVNKIAAGEVVERPASVVKELVENSLDAGARNIEVEVTGGGLELIRVSDDGCGMDLTDLRLCLRPHATSKIASYEDLLNISSYGFRGEALSSIASVSEVVVTTRAVGSRNGWSLKCRHGGTIEERQAGAAQGTTVEVKGLFAFIPARRKFLRSAQTETRRCLEELTHQALANPGIGFRLIADGRISFELLSAEKMERCRQVIGDELYRSMAPIEARSGDLAITGISSQSDRLWTRRREQHIFVNGRKVGHRIVQSAVYQAYGPCLQGRHPSFIIFLEMPPRMVDVNVHPAKREVRFRDDDLIFRFVRSSLEKSVFGQGQPPHAADQWHSPERHYVQEERASWKELSGSKQQTIFNLDSAADAAALPSGAKVQPTPLIQYWQLHNRYILASIKNGLILVDQHAAHERILYEDLMSRPGRIRTQQLMFPASIELTAAESLVFNEYKEIFASLGFDLKAFGGRTIVVDGLPSATAEADAEKVIRAMLADLENTAQAGSDPAERVARSFACHAAIKAGQALSQEEMNRLVDLLFATSSPYLDPHGRPAVIKLTLEDLERRFGRV